MHSNDVEFVLSDQTSWIRVVHWSSDPTLRIELIYYCTYCLIILGGRRGAGERLLNLERTVLTMATVRWTVDVFLLLNYYLLLTHYFILFLYSLVIMAWRLQVSFKPIPN